MLRFTVLRADEHALSLVSPFPVQQLAQAIRDSWLEWLTSCSRLAGSAVALLARREVLRKSRTASVVGLEVICQSKIAAVSHRLQRRNAWHTRTAVVLAQPHPAVRGCEVGRPLGLQNASVRAAQVEPVPRVQSDARDTTGRVRSALCSRDTSATDCASCTAGRVLR